MKTDQNYDYSLNEVYFNELGVRKPDYYLGVVGDRCKDEKLPKEVIRRIVDVTSDVNRQHKSST